MYSSALAATDDEGFIGEMQLGLQFEHQLACSPARYFVRAAVEYQYWNADGASAAAGSQAFTDDVTISSLATADNFEMSLIGFVIGAGLLW